MGLKYECIKSYTNEEIGTVYDENDKPDWFRNYNSIKEFMEKSIIKNRYFKISTKSELTSLPEKWFIKPTQESNKILMDWRGCGYTCSIDKIVLTSDKYWETIDKLNRNLFIEINFEQFKKWVFKEVEDLLEEAKRRYPIGSNIKCLDGDNITLKGHQLILNNNKVYAASYNKSILYSNGKWAEIVISPKQEYPEYYEFIGDTNSFTEGKIYKIRNPFDLEDSVNFIDDSGSKNGYSGNNISYFKPSTKEAYDRQELLKQGNDLHKNYFESLEKTWIPKVGDWIYIEKAESGALGANKSIGIVVNPQLNARGLGTGMYVDIKYFEDKRLNSFDRSVWCIGHEPIIRKATQKEINNCISTSNMYYCSTDPYEKENSLNKVELLTGEVSDVIDIKVNTIKSISIDLYEPKKLLLF